MIETLGAETQQEKKFFTPDLSVTGIQFRDWDLSRPLYPTLIDDSRAPVGIQFDPGVQILSATARRLTFRFEIDPTAGVRFQSDDAGAPVIQSVAAMPGFGPVAGLESAALLGPLTCELTWNQSVAAFKVTALRLCCEPIGRPPSDPERVDGGIYLALIHREEIIQKGVQGADQGRIDETIQILGSDEDGRPIYDLYFRDALKSLPADLSFEPCCRVREGQTASFDMLLSLAKGDDVEFEPSSINPNQVAIQPYQPREWPAQLHDAGRSDLGEKCSLEWVQNLGRSACRISDPDKGRAYCMAGYVTSFYLDVMKIRSQELGHRTARRMRHLQLDPTVIQPPSCTADGICITP